MFLKLHEGERALEILLKLSESGFSRSHNLQAEIGLAYNELRAMELAKKQFKQVNVHQTTFTISFNSTSK